MNTVDSNIPRDNPDKRDYPIKNLVQSTGVKLIGSLKSHEDDIIGLLIEITERLSSPNSLHHLAEIKQYYQSTITLEQVRFIEPVKTKPLDRENLSGNIYPKTIPADYIKSFCRIIFPNIYNYWYTLETQCNQRSQSGLQKTIDEIVTAVYPLAEFSVFLVMPINKFNSHRKNVNYLVRVTRQAIALALYCHLDSIVENKNINKLLIPEHTNQIVNSYFSSIQIFKDFGNSSLNYPKSHEALYDEIWQRISLCYTAIQKLQSSVSVLQGNESHNSGATQGYGASLKSDILDFLIECLADSRFLLDSLGEITHEFLSTKLEQYQGEKSESPFSGKQHFEIFTGKKIPELVSLKGDETKQQSDAMISVSDKANNHSENESAKDIFMPIQRRFLDAENIIGLPSWVDLTPWCSPVDHQRNLRSCSAHAITGIIEYFQNRSTGSYHKLSRLFLHKVTLDLIGASGDIGTPLRETAKAMVLFGAPPEKYWPYNEEKLDAEPNSFCFAYAKNYRALQYFKLDSLDRGDIHCTRNTLLCQIKALLAAGLPCAFGFTLYQSAHLETLSDGTIPLPQDEHFDGSGHAVVAVGYSDYHPVVHTDGSLIYSDRTPLRHCQTRGALLIRNCLGEAWGDHGYGWLPYEYVLQGLTYDWWCLAKAEWLDTGQFGIGTDLPGRGTTWPQ